VLEAASRWFYASQRRLFTAVHIEVERRGKPTLSLAGRGSGERVKIAPGASDSEVGTEAVEEGSLQRAILLPTAPA